MYLKEDESLSKDEMIRRYLESYDQFVKSDYYIACIQIERDRRVYNTGLENSKNEGIQEGISIGRELGFALGKEQGKKDSSLEYAFLLISRQYKNESLDWLNDCSLEQLAYIFKLDLNNYSFQEFKNLILNYHKESH